MRTTYRQIPDARVDGMPIGRREAAPFTIPRLAQITTVVIADASATAGEAWSLTVVDDETAQSYSVSFLSGAALPATLDLALAAVAGDGKLNDLFAVAEDGTDTLTLTARHVGRGYTVTVSAGGSATAAVSVTQVAGGDKIPFARMLARTGTVLRTARELGSGDTLRDMAGFTFRTHFSHTRPYEADAARLAYDGLDRGQTESLMHDGIICVIPETAPTVLDGAVYVRISGTGNVGQVSGAADGGNTVDISSVARWVRLPDAQGICELKIDLF